MYLRYFFKDSTTNAPNHPFKGKSQFTPPLPDNTNLLEYVSRVYLELTSHNNNHTFTHNNYSSEEIASLKSLQNNEELIVKPADKGGAIVIWPKDDYLREASNQLDNTAHYKYIADNPFPSVITNIQKFISNAHKAKLIDYTTYQFLLPPIPTRIPTLYLLPKIHKPDIPGRPIISGCDGPTVRLSKFADHFLKPLVNNTPSYVKDSTAFLNRIFQLNNNLPNNIILITIDVKSLYTNIPNEEGIKACINQLNNDNNTNEDINFIQEILTHVLFNNYFEFNGKYYLQTHGTAMGSPMAPSYANLFMGELEQKILQDAPGGLVPLEWIRFIDDIFAIWTHGNETLMEFLLYINNFHTTIKFDIEHSHKSVHFLDTTIFINNSNQLESDLYIKPTDKTLLLHHNSFHPNSCKNSIIYSQALRYRRLITNDETLHHRLNNLRIILVTRGYSRDIINNAFQKALQYTQHDLLHTNYDNTIYPSHSHHNTNITNNLNFSIPYNTNTTHIGSILRRHWHLIENDPTLKILWPNTPLISYQRNKNLKDQLIHSKFLR